MPREQSKYPTPKDPGDDRGVGPSWRDVQQALDGLKAKTGFEYTFTIHPGGAPGAKSTEYLVVYLRTGFTRPWHSDETKYGQYLRFPNQYAKTMPATLIILAEREWDAVEAYRPTPAQSSFLQDK